MKENFYTNKGYNLKNKPKLTEAMEDYLEMLVRSGKSAVKVTELAKLLHVRSSSVTKMAQKLREKGMISYEPYGNLLITDKGKEIGKFLIKRHTILINFFTLLNKRDVLEEVEQIEHYFKSDTINNLEALTFNMKGK